MKRCFATWVLALFGTLAQAHDFTGTDYSGEYDCTGLDAHAGEYTGTVTLTRVQAHSHGEYGAYTFTLEVPGYGTYLGEAVAQGTQMAIYFALTDPTTHDFGTGLATFSTNADGKTAFHKFYYEPEYEGGNTGTEDCTHR